MATIFDYLDWRGDLPFSIAPVNDVDLYILSKLGMLDYSGIVPGDGAYFPFSQAVERYFAAGGEEFLGSAISPNLMPALRKAAESARFGGVLLSGWRQRIAPEENEQFSALTVLVPGAGHFVTFRGTDDSLVGWKEDLLMTVMEEIPAQGDALRYLQWAAETYPGPLTVCGHSKGGNLAVYAAASLPEAAQRRIERVYSFDGPGFREEFLRSEGYRRIRPRLTFLYPQHTTVGALMYREAEGQIVRCDTPLFGAHDGFTWGVTPRDGFAPAEEFSSASRAFGKAMMEVLEGMSTEERKACIEEFFGVLSAAGAETVTDVSEQRLREALRTVRTLNQSPEVHRWMLDTLEALLQSYAAEMGRTMPRLRLPISFLWKKKEPEAETTVTSPKAADWY